MRQLARKLELTGGPKRAAKVPATARGGAEQCTVAVAGESADAGDTAAPAGQNSGSQRAFQHAKRGRKLQTAVPESLPAR